jgi:dihydroorotase/N-acyl-D-amino-acid deacylase
MPGPLGSGAVPDAADRPRERRREDARREDAGLWPHAVRPYTDAVRNRLWALLLLSSAGGVLLAGQPATNAPAAFDLLITNARIADGTGSPWFRGTIGVRGDTIAAVGTRVDAAAARRIDARGQIVAPGFIDIHTHARRGIFEVPTADNYVRQGVTTLVEGPDGGSPLPIREFLAKLEATPIVANFATFVGQGSIRERVIGQADRKATAEEIARMLDLVREGMRDGAFGLSTGLFYVPGTFTPTEEVVAMAALAGELGGIHISHMRDEAAGVVASVEETIRIGEQGRLPTQVTHHKIIGKANWGRSADTLRLVDEARARGVDATIDQYPYTASSTSIQAALLPAWSQEGGRSRVLERLRDPATRAKITAETVEILRTARGGGDPQNVQIARCEWDPSLDGLRLGDVTKRRGLEPTIGNAAQTALWMVEQGGCQGIFHAIAEEDLVRILRHPATMIASDGEVTVFGRAHPHPRSYGTFARVLGRYVRDERAIPLEDAVRKMTSFPAQRLGLSDRGIVRPGMKADLVIFDPATVADRATFEKPHQYAEGVSVVVVNGQVVFESGAMTPARPGRVLRHAP